MADKPPPRQSLGKEVFNSPTWMSLRQGGDNLSRKARIVNSAIEDRKIKTVVDDERPLLLFRFDGEGWERWSVAGGAYEAVDAPAPPLRLHLDESGATPAAGDRYRLDDGSWRLLGSDEPDPTG